MALLIYGLSKSNMSYTPFGSTSYPSNPAYTRLGTITAVDYDNAKVTVRLDHSNDVSGEFTRDVSYTPLVFREDGTHFIGNYPSIGTSVALNKGEGEQWYIVGFPTPNNSRLPILNEDELLIQSDEHNQIILRTDDGIFIGDRVNNLQVDASKNAMGDNFHSKFSVSDATIKTDGIIRRDLKPNFSLDGSFRRDSLDFDAFAVQIGLDPSLPVYSSNTDSLSRNPALTETKEIVYEFANSFNFGTDKQEFEQYQNHTASIDKLYYNRRESRIDALSLSAAAPNFLIESIKGTVVDIYGNILDLNRSVLPIGKEKAYTFLDSQNKSETFLRIREAQRKSIAFHFEINTRTAKVNSLQTVPKPSDHLSGDNWRTSSKFFIDIDKEGQFKVNVPASSEVGNIPFLTRYENSSNLQAAQNGSNVNEFISADKVSGKDIYQNSFAFKGGTISISDPQYKSAYSVPKDRVLNQVLKHGTAYHDITRTLWSFQGVQSFIPFELPPINTIFNSIPPLGSPVSETITISGPDANAGGRSGSINFDGSIELNIGANKIDRQSLWLDTEGGIIGNVGRDKKMVSVGLSLTGAMLIEIGGTETVTDRFKSLNNAWVPGTFDIRIYHRNKSEVTIIRADNDGVHVSSPSNISLVSSKDVLIKGNNVFIDGENIQFFPSSSKRVVERATRKMI
jgi:hypothetical protein